jgi:glycosyltransferase involved in cell wall biosynthesis
VNILLVSQPARDGVLRHVIGLADFLISQGDRVHLAYSDCNASDQLHSLVDRVRSAGGLTLNLGVRNAPQPRDVLAASRLLALIRKVSPDVIHAHSSKAGALVRGLGLVGLRTPMLYTPHSYFRMHQRQEPKARLFHLLERLFGRIGTTITMSGSESSFAETVVGLPRSQQLVIGNGVDFETFSPSTAQNRLDLRARFQLPPEAKLIGTVGRFSAQKDSLTMYSAFAEVVNALPDVHLVHLGQGELEPEVDELIAAKGMAARCHRLSYLREPAQFYADLDGFILTSLYEGMSYAVLEALASNLPLVLTRAPGSVDFADHNFSHISWCEPGSAGSIAAAIREWRVSLDGESEPNHRSVARPIFALEPSLKPVREAYRRLLRPEAPQESTPLGSLGIGRNRNLTGRVE